MWTISSECKKVFDEQKRRRQLSKTQNEDNIKEIIHNLKKVKISYSCMKMTNKHICEIKN